ncbi:hypothetical protein KC207_04360 [Phycicoccus sp. BSK3Z-2]|uniref:Uncharacterized protein n=1 Tax=Phycicoccus avicenniae TaxID=2828860 RepID=A0A941HZ44_9MICO|nr:DUF6069 family protein [Phycicoccus avicenniae]MBR7742520.1 hypothetical protein [Phycicoccus avicenniae]
MSTITPTAEVAPRPVPTVSTLVAVVVRAAVVALVANIVLQTIARIAGVETVVVPPGAAAVTVAPVSVVTMTVVPLVVGGAVLLVASRISAAAVTALPWIGVVLGVGTALMPLSMGGDLAGRLVLAAMHVVVGVAWFVSVRRSQG